MRYEAFASVIGRGDPVEADSPEAAALRVADRYSLPDGAVVLVGKGNDVAGAFRVFLERRVELVDDVAYVSRKAVPVSPDRLGS